MGMENEHERACEGHASLRVRRGSVLPLGRDEQFKDSTVVVLPPAHAVSAHE